MKLTAIQIDSFGIWKHVSFDGLSETITVFHGPNEAGKTTLLEFVRAALYGFSSTHVQPYVTAAGGDRVGGSLRFVSDSGPLIVRRHIDRHESEQETTDLIGADGTRWSPQDVSAALGEVDEATYRRVFAVGLSELQQLATLSDLDASRCLYDLSLGVAGLSLVEAGRQLKARRNRILSPDGGPSQVLRLIERRERLEADIGRLPTLGGTWAELAARKVRLNQQWEQLKGEREGLAREADQLQIALSVEQPWQRRRLVDEQLAPLDTNLALPAESVEQFQRLGALLGRLRRQHSEANRRYKRLKRQLTTLKAPQALWRQGPRIEALGHQLDWLVSVEQQLATRASEVSSAKERWTGQHTSSAAGQAAPSAELCEAARRALPGLRRPARALRSSGAEFDAAEDALAENQATAERLAIELRSKLAHTSHDDVAAAVSRAGERASALRRWVDLDERLDEMGRHRGQLQQQVQALLEKQMLPLGVLVSLGAIFALGVAMTLAGLWLPTSLVGSLGRSLAVLGILGAASSALLKLLVERSNSRRLAECRQQIEVIGRQLAESRDEREQLDRQLPAGSGPLTLRLQAAERELASLEELLPLDAQRQAATRKSELAQARVEQARRQLGEARLAWQQALAAAGLPESLDPSGVLRLAKRSHQLRGLDSQLQQLQQDLQARRREYDALRGRICQLSADVGLPPGDAAASDLVRGLVTTWSEHQPKLKRRAQLRRRARRLRRRIRRISAAIHRRTAQRRQWMAQVGVASPKEFRQLARREAHVRRLLRERDTIDRELNLAASRIGGQEVLALYLAKPSADALLDRQQKTAQRLGQLDASLKACLESRGAVEQQLESLASDRQLIERNFELAGIECQLDGALSQWQVHAVAARLLEALRQHYEKHCQPETLVQASEYLRQLTSGRYPRVWTPLDRDTLYVDRRRGQTLAVEMLSRGTREQLFLALRLALIERLARQGIRLPAVLDDVLVNFDVKRSRAAARLLLDFAARGHQLLLFTCHRHIRRVFQAMGVDTRPLPRRGRPRRHAASVAHSLDRPAPNATPPLHIEPDDLDSKVAEDTNPYDGEDKEWVELPAPHEPTVWSAARLDVALADRQDLPVDLAHINGELAVDAAQRAADEEALITAAAGERVASEPETLNLPAEAEGPPRRPVDQASPPASNAPKPTSVESADRQLGDGTWVRIGAGVRRRDMLAPRHSDVARRSAGHAATREPGASSPR